MGIERPPCTLDTRRFVFNFMQMEVGLGYRKRDNQKESLLHNNQTNYMQH